MSKTTLSLFVVDDDEGVRNSYGLLLRSRGYAVQGFDSGEAFLEAIDDQRSGCVIMDLRMDGMSGLQVFDRLRSRRSPLMVVFLSGHGDIPTAFGATDSGALTWLQKPCADDVLLHWVGLAFDRARGLAQALKFWDDLSQKEKDVALLVAQGRTNSDIADALFLSVRTVEQHRANILAKLKDATGLKKVNSTVLANFLRDNQPWPLAGLRPRADARSSNWAEDCAAAADHSKLEPPRESR